MASYSKALQRLVFQGRFSNLPASCHWPRKRLAMTSAAAKCRAGSARREGDDRRYVRRRMPGSLWFCRSERTAMRRAGQPRTHSSSTYHTTGSRASYLFLKFAYTDSTTALHRLLNHSTSIRFAVEGRQAFAPLKRRKRKMTIPNLFEFSAGCRSHFR